MPQPVPQDRPQGTQRRETQRGCRWCGLRLHPGAVARLLVYRSQERNQQFLLRQLPALAPCGCHRATEVRRPDSQSDPERRQVLGCAERCFPQHAFAAQVQGSGWATRHG